MAGSDFLRLVFEEFRARGWNAVLHGPEAHLAMPWIAGLTMIVIIVWIIYEERRK